MYKDCDERYGILSPIALVITALVTQLIEIIVAGYLRPDFLGGTCTPITTPG